LLLLCNALTLMINSAHMLSISCRKIAARPAQGPGFASPLARLCAPSFFLMIFGLTTAATPIAAAAAD
jgi:hypothetical protein